MKRFWQRGAVAVLPILLLLLALVGIALAVYVTQNRLSTTPHADQTTCSSICNNQASCKQACPLYIKDGSCPSLCNNPSACLAKCQQVAGGGGGNGGSCPSGFKQQTCNKWAVTVAPNPPDV